MSEESKVASIGDDAEYLRLMDALCQAATDCEASGYYRETIDRKDAAARNLASYIDSRPRQGDQVATVPRLDYDLLKLVLEQTQERLRHADVFVAQQEAIALAAPRAPSDTHGAARLDLSKLTRYELTSDYEGDHYMAPEEDGEYVRFDDVAALAQQAPDTMRDGEA